MLPGPDCLFVLTEQHCGMMSPRYAAAPQPNLRPSVQRFSTQSTQRSVLSIQLQSLLRPDCVSLDHSTRAHGRQGQKILSVFVDHLVAQEFSL
jgi:hypothetical protein